MVAKKTAKRKAVKKTAKTKAKTTTKRAAKAKTPTVKLTKTRTKSALMTAIAETTELPRTDVNAVFEALREVIEQDLGRKGPGTFALPGLMKIRVIKKPATKARKGTNPFTGEPMTFKAKPARNVVRIRPLSGLKDMV